MFQEYPQGVVRKSKMAAAAVPKSSSCLCTYIKHIKRPEYFVHLLHSKIREEEPQDLRQRHYISVFRLSISTVLTDILQQLCNLPLPFFSQYKKIQKNKKTLTNFRISELDISDSWGKLNFAKLLHATEHNSYPCIGAIFMYHEYIVFTMKLSKKNRLN